MQDVYTYSLKPDGCMSLYDSTKSGRAAGLVMALSKLRQSSTSRNGSNPLSMVCGKSLQGRSNHTRTLLYIAKPFTALMQEKRSLKVSEGRSPCKPQSYALSVKI